MSASLRPSAMSQSQANLFSTCSFFGRYSPQPHLVVGCLVGLVQPCQTLERNVVVRQKFDRSGVPIDLFDDAPEVLQEVGAFT